MIGEYAKTRRASANAAFRWENKGGVSAASLCGPWGVALDSSDDLYVADSGNNRVPKYKSPLSGVSADLVIGQGGSFNSAALTRAEEGPPARANPVTWRWTRRTTCTWRIGATGGWWNTTRRWERWRAVT